MGIYGVHYAWVPGRPAQGPVGIWDESGARYYPPRTAEFEQAGAYHVLDRPETFSFAGWLEMKCETTSTTTNWDRIDSDQPMQAVLDELQSQFFAVPHPVLELPGSIGEQARTSDREALVIEPPRLARRREIAESWWIGSELVARHPEWMLHEMHPAGGAADDLAVVSASKKILAHLNREGTIHIETGFTDGTVHISWAEAFSFDSPHGLVKQVEALMGVGLTGKRPASTPRSISYRFLAAALAIGLNDRAEWDARNEFLDTSEWIDQTTRGFLSSFPAALADKREIATTGMWGEPDSHFWALLRDGAPAALVSTEGQLYCGHQRFDLLSEYRETRSIMKSVLQHIEFS